MSVQNVMIMAGGTGGHVYPGLAVAAVLAKREVEVNWLGSVNSFESKLIPTQKLNFNAVNVAGLRGKGIMQKLTAPWMLARAVIQALKVFRRIRPQAAISFGGFAAGPGGLAATLLRVPLYVHEQNRIPGVTNRVLAKFARRVLCGFPGSFAGNNKMDYIGNPVRAEIIALDAPSLRFQDRSGPLRVLCLGGSLGAKALNDCIPQALALMTDAFRPQVTHQTGSANHAAVEAAYAEAKQHAEVVPFIDDMAQRLADCDVIVCRAGAVTVSELCAAGVAAVLVPLIVSTTSHQRDNAQWLAGHGAGIHLPQSELTPRKLADLLSSLTRDALLAMATKARVLAKPRAAARVADQIEGLVPA